MKGFLYTLGILSSIGIYLIVFAMMYAFSQKDVLEIMAIDLIAFMCVSFPIFKKIEDIVRRFGDAKN